MTYTTETVLGPFPWPLSFADEAQVSALDAWAKPLDLMICYTVKGSGNLPRNAMYHTEPRHPEAA